MMVKQFIPPNLKNPWGYWQELAKEGTVISIPLKENRLEPANAHDIRELFKEREYIAREYDEIESVVSYLNHEVSEHQRDFQVPMANSVEYLLLFNDHALAFLSGEDEYLGQGDSETYFELKGIALLDDKVTADELSEIVDWFKEAFTY